MRAVVNVSWAVAILFECILLWCLRKERSWFVLWIFADLVVSLVSIWANVVSPGNLYAKVWAISQLPLLIAFSAATIEQLSLCLVEVLIAAAFLVFEAGFLWFQTPLRLRLFAAHVAVSGFMSFAFVLKGTWDGLRPRARVMLLFCMFDCVGYLAELLGSARFYPAAVLMIGQGSCMLMWLIISIGERAAVNDRIDLRLYE